MNDEEREELEGLQEDLKLLKKEINRLRRRIEKLERQGVPLTAAFGTKL